MESLTASSIGGRLPLRFPSTSRKHRSLSHHHRRPRFRALASGDGSELDRWDQMELKFGRLLGEDPKLTLAKIMARKANPNVSYLEVEKSFHKNKASMRKGVKATAELNLSRPAMIKGGNATRPVERT